MLILPGEIREKKVTKPEGVIKHVEIDPKWTVGLCHNELSVQRKETLGSRLK